MHSPKYCDAMYNLGVAFSETGQVGGEGEGCGVGRTQDIFIYL